MPKEKTKMERTAPEIVGEALDNSPLTRIHKWIVALIAAGYFLDVLDYVIFGSMIPIMLTEHFASRNALALVGSAQLTGLAIGTLLQGQFTDRMGRKTVYQFNLLLFGLATLAGAFASDAGWLAVFRFVAGIGLGAEQPLGFAYAGEFAPKRLRGRILALIHFIGGAMVWPIAALLALFLGTAVGWRGLWIGIGIGALIVFGLRFALPESPRWLSSQGRHAEAFRTLARMGVATMQPVLAAYRDGRADEAIVRRDPFTIVWRSYGNRLLAAALSLSAFFCVTIGLGTWLPNILESKGFTITRSLTFTFGMTLAAPCASLVMMYTLDRYGRKVTSVTAFVGAGLMAIFFAQVKSNTELLVAGFLMIFCYQIAGNAMQIFTSEVFPTNARASGFGMAAGIGRLAVAGFIPLIPWIQNIYGLAAVFVTLAALLAVAAVTVNFIGPETKRRALEEIAMTHGLEQRQSSPGLVHSLPHKEGGT
jgi:MFS transporter, putative metabolite:H+ symporter